QQKKDRTDTPWHAAAMGQSCCFGREKALALAAPAAQATAPAREAGAKQAPVAPPAASAAAEEKAQSEMGALVVETMNFLGMAQNSERFLWLLQHSNVTSLRHLECLSQDECLKLQLPWDLVAAVQKRLRVWKLEMQDEAELALEQGELHYQMEEPVNPLKNSTLVDKLHAVQAAGQESHPQVQYAPPLPGMVADDSHIQRIEVAFHHHADDPFEPPLIDVGDFLEARRLSREERARAYLQEARRNLPQQPAHICGGRCARACGHPENDDLRQFTCDVGHFYDVERLFWRIPRREGWWNDWHIEIEEPEELQTVNENEII
ncbi:unnamed protein product, partial [Durusdinium trenchii]